MLTIPWGGRFSEAAAIVLSGAGRVDGCGNSLMTPNLDYLWYDSFPRALGTRVRWHYFVASGQNASQCMSQNLGYGSIGSVTTNDCGSVRTETTYEVPAATGVTARIMGPCRIHKLDLVGDGVNFGSGIILPRQIAATPAHSNAQRNTPWPCLASNAGEPWFHNTYMKGKLVYWVATANNLDEFNVNLLRQGNNANNSSSSTAHTNAASADHISSTPWTPALTDAGTYDTSTNGVPNDHEVALRINGKTGYSEANKILIPLAAVFARCDSGGTVPANANGTRASYCMVGRSGCYVSDWLNYCTQTDWQEWFTATILSDDVPVMVDFFALDHNISPSGIDVGDVDGSQVEQSSNVTTSYWKKRYKALIARRKAAYLAAFPTGKYIPIVIVGHPVPGSSAMNTTVPGRITDVNRVSKEIALESDGGWFSFAECFQAADGTWQPAFVNLHPWTPENGRILAETLMAAMDAATNNIYAPLGPVAMTLRNRNR